jgi:hypothetical protein
MTKVYKNSKAVKEKTGGQSQIQWCKLKVVTNRHEDFNFVFTKHGRGWNIPYEDKKTAKAQNKN